MAVLDFIHAHKVSAILISLHSHCSHLKNSVKPRCDNIWPVAGLFVAVYTIIHWMFHMHVHENTTWAGDLLDDHVAAALEQ